jgi:hypothetical protein
MRIKQGLVACNLLRPLQPTKATTLNNQYLLRHISDFKKCVLFPFNTYRQVSFCIK